jgi:Uncharacterized protein conserved in bacteria (DUF2188)
MSRNSQHVVPNGKEWSIRKAGALRATGIFKTRDEAVKKASEIARNQKSELYIHGKDGRIRKRNSFGGDPHPSKG